MARSDRRTFSFPKSARLLRRSDYDALREGGHKFSEGPLAASWVQRPSGAAAAGMGAGGARVGIAVSSNVGQAVVLVKDIEGEKRLAGYVTPKHDADVSPRAPMQFSLFYFAEGELDATRDIYRL